MAQGPSSAADDGSSAAMVTVPAAISIGLLCSFVQSLGLTIQRKSYLNSACPHAADPDRPQWKKPLWLVGFTIFIVANVGGTVFQIGALPIVMLAPLGAVSLLYNALLAKFLLDDVLGRMMIGGESSKIALQKAMHSKGSSELIVTESSPLDRRNRTDPSWSRPHRLLWRHSRTTTFTRTAAGPFWSTALHCPSDHPLLELLLRRYHRPPR